MKKILFAGILLLGSIVNAQTTKLKDIAGKWEVVGEQNATLNIIDSSTIEFTYMGERKTITDYKADFSKTPCWLDFSASDSSGVLQVKSLVQKVGDDILKWQLFVDEERAQHFTTGKGEMYYLKKAKPSTSAIAATQ
jgi:hypothetical protein